MARKTKEEAEKTYWALLDSSAALFLEKGIAATTLHEISARAGVTRGALYWHFKGKGEIIMAIIDSFAVPHLKHFKQAIEQLPQQNTAAAFRRILHNLMREISTDKRAGQALAIVFHVVEETAEQTELQLFLNKIRAERIEDFLHASHLLQKYGALRPELAPDLAAKGLAAYLLGLVNQQFSPHPFADLKVESEQLLDLYLDAILHEDD